MNILTIGTDKTLFQYHSPASERIREYGRLFGELHIIVFNTGEENDVKLSENIYVYPTNSKSKLHYLRDAYRMGIGIINAKRAGEMAIDAVSTQDASETGIIGWLLKRKFGIKLQLQIHTDIFSPYFYREGFFNSLRYHLARFLIGRADGVRVVSARLRKHLEAKMAARTFRWQWKIKAKIVSLPIWTDAAQLKAATIGEHLRSKYSDYDFFILMASRLTKEKNVGLAIRAFADMLLRFPKMVLIIAGEGPEYRGLKNMVYKLHIEDNVKFEGWTEDLVSYYKTADIFLITSNYEGWGRTAAEALACGLPVIMTDVGCSYELVKPYVNGLVFDIGNAKQLKMAISELRENKDLLSNLRKNARESARNLMTKEEYLQKYKQALEEL